MLLGRGRTLDGATRSIEDRGVRCLVVTGRAGVGKTAFALALGRRLQEEQLLVPVGAAEPHEVLVRLGRGLGITEARHGIGTAVADALAEKAAVLVLDGCDDLDAVTPVVRRLLTRSDDLVVLVTTRTAATAHGFRVVHLRPLDVPDADAHDEGALRANPSVQLFVHRAQAVDPTFEPSVDDLAAIGDVCRRLDGLPSAIALAASRITLMQPGAMSREMGRVGAWHLVGVSLRDELARSVELLDDDHRRLLLALDAFDGGASVDALHEVAGHGTLADTIDALGALVDLDLVAVDRERARCWLTSAMASHVGDVLDRAPADELRARHAAHFAASARDRAFQIADPDLAIDHGNRLAAVRWLRGAGEYGRALRLLVDMAADFDRRGEPDAGRHLLTSALANADDADPRTTARAHLWVARFIAESPDPVDRQLAIDHLRSAWRIAEDTGHEPTIFVVLFTICENHTLLGSLELAEEAIASGLERAAGGRHPIAEAGLLTWRAVMIHQQGDETGAAATIAAAIDKAVALGDRRLIVRSCLVFLGLPPDVRAAVLTESPPLHRLLEMAREDGDHRSEGWLLALAAGNAVDDGDPVRAAAAARELFAVAVGRANAPLGRLALAVTARLAAATTAAGLAARLAGALDRHGPVIEASMAPHSYASYRRAVRDAERTLGRQLHSRLRAGGAAEAWEDLTDAADGFLASILDGSITTLDAPEDVTDLLSPREQEVLSGLVAGRSNKDIAADLGLRPKTVMHHCASIYRKLGVSGRAGAVAMALQRGYEPTGP